MSTKTMRTLLAVVTLAVASDAQAAWVYVSGKWLWKSIDCTVDLKQVPNPDSHPVLTVCDALVTSILVYCVNPATHAISPGKSAIQPIDFTATHQLSSGDVNKVKGTGKVSIKIDVESGLSQFLDPQYCVNPNWTPVGVLVNQFDGKFDLFKCTATDPATGACTATETTPCTEAQSSCTLPGKLSLTASDFASDGSGAYVGPALNYACTAPALPFNGCPVN
jgi:hypothetical protein